jgi:predicted MPP superfamily phosphohydrolase
MRLPTLGFFATIIAIDAALHYYLWARLVRDPGWPPPVRIAGLVAIVLLAIGLPVGVILSRNLPRSWATPIAASAYIWMGTAFYLFIALLAGDVVRALAAGSHWILGWMGANREADLARRALMAGTVAKVAGATAVAASAVALRSGLGEVDVKEVGVKLPRLPKALDGLTLVQLSDVHVGPTIGRRFIEGIVEKTNRQKPDAVVITGDLVDGSVDDLREQVAPLAKLAARYGVYFITGNHEYYSGVREWTDELRRMGIRVLRNQMAPIGDANGATIDLLGVDDHLSHELAVEGSGDLLVQMFGARDPERESILLAHQPKAIAAAAEAKIGLQLSGHTHGGQIWPFSGLVALTQPYLAGLHRRSDTTQIYVSRGTGYWGPPMRLLAPAEVTKIVLAPT